MVATCESNENGRFLTQLGLAKLSLEGKSKMLFFSERQNYFEEKSTGFLYSCLGLAICKRGGNLILLDSCGDLLLICAACLPKSVA